MKTKLFTLLLAVAASVGTMFAQLVQIDDLYYNLDATNQTAEVARNSSASGEIIIPASVEYNSVTYSVTSISMVAFYGCSGLTSVTIPNSVTSIGYMTFAECTGLTSIEIPNSVTSIGYMTFAECTGLTSIEIPNSVTSIGSYAFRGCSGLTSVTIPNSVTSIGNSAFRGCSGLTSVTIPNSVTSIEYAAFAECTGLTSITCEAITPPTLGSYVFSSVDKSIPLYVPGSSILAYKSADQWKDFTNILPISQQGLEDVQGNNVQCTKIVHDGQIYILRGEKVYTLTGAEVK